MKKEGILLVPLYFKNKESNHQRMIFLFCTTIVLLFTISFFIPSVYADNKEKLRLEKYSEILAEGGGIHLTGNIFCEANDGNGQSYPLYNGSDSSTLLSLAKYKKIYLFAHGLYLHIRKDAPSEIELKETWGGHLDLINNQNDPYATCYFSIDTGDGFGKQQSFIGEFLFALRALVDDSELYDSMRCLYLVGFSAGVNYLKDALLTYQEHLSYNNISHEGLKPTQMRMIFLGGPHRGSSSVELARFGNMLLSALEQGEDRKIRGYEAGFNKRMQEKIMHERYRFLYSPGVKQIEDGSRDLIMLNNKFYDAITKNIKLFNIISRTDLVAPPETASLPIGKQITISSLTHSGFASRNLDPELKLHLQKLYSTQQ